MCYHFPGFGYNIGEALPGEREFFVRWLVDQKRREKEAQDKALK